MGGSERLREPGVTHCSSRRSEQKSEAVAFTGRRPKSRPLPGRVVQTSEAADEVSGRPQLPGAGAAVGGLVHAALPPVCRCEAAAGDGAARLEHVLCLHLPPRHQEGPGAAVYQLLHLF